MNRIITALLFAFAVSGWLSAQTVTKPKLTAAPFKACVTIDRSEADALAALEMTEHDPRILPNGTPITTVEQWLTVRVGKQIRAWVSEGQQRYRQGLAQDMEGMTPADRAAIEAEIAKRKVKP